MSRYSLTKQGRRQYPKAGGFYAEDPLASYLTALDTFDPATGKATKAAIFTQRVVNAAPAPETVESPEDALALSLDLRGKVDLELIQDLLGLGSLQQTRKVLGELASTT